MELLLNLAWLLLALPAFWLWRRCAPAGAERKFNSIQVLLALGGVLVLLFPVISASDDLRAMRAEIEDSSSTSKRTVRQSGGERNSGWTGLQGPPALAASAIGQAATETRRFESFVRYISPLAAHHVLHGGRAPPFSFQG